MDYSTEHRLIAVGCSNCLDDSDFNARRCPNCGGNLLHVFASANSSIGSFTESKQYPRWRWTASAPEEDIQGDPVAQILGHLARL